MFLIAIYLILLNPQNTQSIKLPTKCPQVVPTDKFQFFTGIPMLSIPFSTNRESYFFTKIDSANNYKYYLYTLMSVFNNHPHLIMNFEIGADKQLLIDAYFDDEVRQRNMTTTIRLNVDNSLTCYKPIYETVHLWPVGDVLILWSCVEEEESDFANAALLIATSSEVTGNQTKDVIQVVSKYIPMDILNYLLNNTEEFPEKQYQCDKNKAYLLIFMFVYFIIFLVVFSWMYAEKWLSNNAVVPIVPE